MVEERVEFPSGFLWGAATAAHQVEGGNRNNDWWLWEQEAGRISDGSRSGAAVEWWRGRAEEDLQRAAAMGHNAHRLSIEWSRLEPSMGVYDETAFERYRAILSTMRELGMTPVVTLYHFTLPRWAAALGGWLNPELIDHFGRFAAESVRRLGDLVGWWATINEPMILVYFGYAGRRWPPGLGSIGAGFQAAATLLRAHHAAYLGAKAAVPDARVGIVLNMPCFDPATTSSLDRLVARGQDWVMSEMILHALDRGELPMPLAMRAEPLAGGPHAVDWYGLNYYGRNLVKFDMTRPGDLFGRHIEEAIHTDEQSWGEVYPPGLTNGLLRLAARKQPLFVTENGIFDNHDQLRPAYLLLHLRAMHDAMRQGADVRGYFHWSLVDNFEWAEGWRTHFGLIAVNPVTQERQPRRSAQVYEQVIRAGAIEPELWQAEVEKSPLRRAERGLFRSPS